MQKHPPRTRKYVFLSTGAVCIAACYVRRKPPPMQIDDLLRTAMDQKASDLHLKVGNYPHLRVDGELVPLTDQPRVSAEDMLNMAFSMMSNRQKQKFKEQAELDMAYGVAGLGRFRVNVFQQRGNVGLVLRVIPTKIRPLDELHMPAIVEHICDEQRGLVLVTGITGSGKSTTLAAMVDRINSSRPEHIITIEDPIEFLHRDKKGFVNQREVEVDTPSFASALRASLRQDPDTILVGEMRDVETIATALHAAETGHMVFSTLHTLDAVETVNRIISVFPPSEQKQIRLQVASTLRAVISQRLVKRVDGVGRVPAVEVLIATPYIRECIITPEKTRYIKEAIAAGTSQYGMQTFDQSLYDLYAQGLVSYETAVESASNPDDFRLRVQGIASTADAAREEMEQANFGR
jgi:twitching motility protein PilT